MGGVLRDSGGKVLCFFCWYLGIHDANTVEVHTIHKACSLCCTKEELKGRKITIVSDSKVAVSWINNAGIGSLKHIDFIFDIRGMLNEMGNTVVVFNSRASNSFADMLAKRGSTRTGDVVEWGGS
ncbi:hypothetical protein Dsin_017344 [Dipteronia sinensis]|uniref:RNase H type-1 domain-containing protein n=1 Tax=Dipteronia sinensis TaxID=43782 RepID=A0AAE0AFS9_9ROSI|nr:hypothetical protein Dsin_017344 [Dipteronia sinensis]